SKHERNGSHGSPTLSDIVSQLADARRHASISAPTPGVIAGEPAYTVRVAPLQNGGLLGAAELAWDAAHGVPLRIALYARGESKPAVEIAVTDIKFGSVDSSIFPLRTSAGGNRVDLQGGGASRR